MKCYHSFTNTIKLKTTITEDTIYNKTLCPYFWNDEMELNQRVRNKLLNIANDFISGIETIDKSNIKDIILTGSLTNYNWTDLSDFDLHIKIDYKDFSDSQETLKELFDMAKVIWNNKHDIKFKGFPVEIYIQDVNESMLTEYSLIDNVWLKKPVYNEPKIDEHFVNKKVDDYVRKIDFYERTSQENLSNIDAEILYNKVKQIKKTISANRAEGIKKSKSEFNEYNLIFKKLRNLGYIEKIVNLVSTFYDASFSE